MFVLLDRPTEVRLGIYINSFYSISEQTMVSMKLHNTQWTVKLSLQGFIASIFHCNVVVILLIHWSSFVSIVRSVDVII